MRAWKTEQVKGSHKLNLAYEEQQKPILSSFHIHIRQKYYNNTHNSVYQEELKQ